MQPAAIALTGAAVAQSTIVGAQVSWPRTLRYGTPEWFAAEVSGRTILAVGRRAGRELACGLRDRGSVGGRRDGRARRLRRPRGREVSGEEFAEEMVKASQVK